MSLCFHSRFARCAKGSNETRGPPLKKILRQMRVFHGIREDSPIFIKKVFKILPLLQIATWRSNFETRTMLDCLCYGQHSHENESRIEIRREPFIRALFVLDKTCSYEWYNHIAIGRKVPSTCLQNVLPFHWLILVLTQLDFSHL